MDFNTYKSTFACLITTTTRSKSLYKAHRKKKSQMGQAFLFGGVGVEKTKPKPKHSKRRPCGSKHAPFRKSYGQVRIDYQCRQLKYKYSFLLQAANLTSDKVYRV